MILQLPHKSIRDRAVQDNFDHLIREWEEHPPGVPTYVTALPTTGLKEGLEVYFVADAAKRIIWHLRYNATTGLWESVGSTPLFEEVAGGTSTASGSYSDLGGPSLALPLAGDYIIELGCRIYNTVNAAGGFMSYAIGATPIVTATLDADGIDYYSTTNTVVNVAAMAKRKTGLGAVTLAARYRANVGGSAVFEKRWMRATPLKVS